MNETPTATADSGGSFGAQQAASLLDRTTQQARRQIEPARPWLLMIRGVMVLGILTVVWLSVRGQHPYQRPTAAVIPFCIAFGVLNLLVTIAFARRATTGIAGRSRLHPIEITILAVAWIGPYVAIAPLAGAGVRPAIVYGVLPSAVPLLAAGLAWAAMMAVRAHWRRCGTGLAVAAVAGVAIATGPIDVWLTLGIGLCAALLGTAVVILWQQHRSTV